jgi:poly(A) polymerase Pap1
MKAEEIFRFALKAAQFIVTFLLLYAIGFPYWMIVAAALLVPIYCKLFKE